ncbi:hypothetical protein [Microbacterium paulum]
MDGYICPTCGEAIPADSMHWLIGELVYCDEHGAAAQTVTASCMTPKPVVQILSAANVAARVAGKVVSDNA